MLADVVVGHIAEIAVVVHGTAVGVERSYVLDQSVGSGDFEQGTAGTGTGVEHGKVERPWMVRSSGHSWAEAEEVAVGTEVEQQMERELGTTFAGGTADAAGRIDQLCVD